MPEHYVWLTWATSFLLPWGALFLAFPDRRKAMIWSSLFTMPFGLTEPLFVPEYWNPPSLFDLAQKTGFDLESLVFCFAIGGVGAVLYDLITRRKQIELSEKEKHNPHHRFHPLIVASPFVVFLSLVWLPWNPIYPGIIAMFAGAAATCWCRPDLLRKSWIGGVLFLGYYLVFLAGLEATSPGYIDRVWNVEELLPFRILGMPLEELLFAAGFGTYWSGIYDHFRWRGSVATAPES
ncbi:MAG: hypothetical protein KDM63_04625 [Verrucomicrobiae bacterium]|nr:hypothetical protein [Verrucomicrobiae bacterium]MCB1231217.1 hypothetical protein [Verrucomicrobiae bacterium]